MRGEGAILRNAEGQPFLKDHHPMAELAPRDIVARAIFNEMGRIGADHVLLDVTHLPAEAVRNRFPTIFRFCLDHDLDITVSPIPVAPAAHYMMGGVKTNVWGETTIDRLFAAGEVACTGVHGANRLASNSLLDTSVFARRVVQRSLEAPSLRDRDRTTRAEMTVALSDSSDSAPGAKEPTLQGVQELMGSLVGMVRNRDGLSQAVTSLSGWTQSQRESTDRASHELANLTLLGHLISQSALIREESRGAHFREDFPKPSPQWLKHIVLSNTQASGQG